MKVYVVVFEGSTEDYSNTDIFVYGDYYKAYDKFKELICNERNPDVSWVGNLDFDDDGEPIGHYELDFEDNVCIIKLNEDGTKYKIVYGLVNGGRPKKTSVIHLDIVCTTTRFLSNG